MLCTSLAVLKDHRLRSPPATVAPSLGDTLPTREHMENPIPPDWKPGQPPLGSQWAAEPDSVGAGARLCRHLWFPCGLTHLLLLEEELG